MAIGYAKCSNSGAAFNFSSLEGVDVLRDQGRGCWAIRWYARDNTLIIHERNLSPHKE